MAEDVVAEDVSEEEDVEDAVGDVDVDVDADVDELLDEVLDEAVSELEPAVDEGAGMVSVVVSSDEADCDALLEISDELRVLVPRVVGTARALGLCVKSISALVMVTPSSRPVALSATVAARSLAVPQPNCEYPPSNTFL